MHGGNVYKFLRDHKTLEDVIDFSANINPLGMSKKGLDAMDFQELLHYPDPEYYDLKMAIAKFENVDVENIVLGNGAIECIFLLAEALKLDKVVLLAPTFSEYERAFSKYGTCLFHPLDLQSPNLEFEEANAYVICNPNNPTGQVFDHNQLVDLLKKCEEKNQYLIIDEAFLDFSKEVSMKKYQSPNLIIFKSVTKFFAVPGLRMGYLLTWKQSIRDAIENNRITWPINQLAARYTEFALQDTDYIKESITYVEKERLFMYTALEALGLKVYKSGGNYLFFYTDCHNLNEGLMNYGILIRDCSNYRNLEKGYFRVAIKTHDENIKLIEAIRENLNGDH